MNFKDYLRILGRRWITLTSISILVFATLYLLTQTEPVFYTAQAKVLIEAPSPIKIFQSSSERLLPHSAQIATWVELITEETIRSRVKNHLDPKEYPPELLGEWITRVRTKRHEGTLLTSIIAEGPTQKFAVDLANAYGSATEAYSKEESNRALKEGLRHAESLTQEKQKKIEALRNELKDIFPSVGVDSLPHEVSRLNQEYRSTVNRIHIIDQTTHANRTRIRHLQENRQKFTALHSQGIPRGDRFADMITSVDSTLLQHRESIKERRIDLLKAKEKYKPLHPTIHLLNKEIQEMEASLTEKTLSTLRYDLDREEVIS